VHLVWGLGKRVQLGNDALHSGPDAANRLLKGLLSPFGNFAAFEAACQGPCWVLCDLDEH
jgi:hypothetical protein